MIKAPDGLDHKAVQNPASPVFSFPPDPTNQALSVERWRPAQKVVGLMIKALGAATVGGPGLTLELKRIVVTTDGENIDVGVVEFVYQSVSLAQTSRPKAGKAMTKRFGFSQSGGGVTPQHFFKNGPEVFVHSIIALPQILVHLPRSTLEHQ
jgi:hypothetical protein